MGTSKLDRIRSMAALWRSLPHLIPGMIPNRARRNTILFLFYLLVVLLVGGRLL